jgi:uncharacterized small protein (DUF1192 family)
MCQNGILIKPRLAVVIALIQTGTLQMALFEDDKPKRKVTHEVGQDLYLLSVGDLEERIAYLSAEIARLEADKIQKQSSKAAANALFKS